MSPFVTVPQRLPVLLCRQTHSQVVSWLSCCLLAGSIVGNGLFPLQLACSLAALLGMACLPCSSHARWQHCWEWPACLPCSSHALSLWFLLPSVSLGFGDDISSALISISTVCPDPCLYFSLLFSLDFEEQFVNPELEG